ncbi:MAG TPA: hypothetical protein DD460_04405 [Acidobacteria bacterium]|nr:hypothetical protein [Acidobacteriota bacterium]
MKILHHLGRQSILLGLFGFVWMFAVSYEDFGWAVPFAPEYVLIAISVFLLVMDLVKRKTAGKIHIAMTGIRTFGKWSLVGFFFNTITVVLGLLANGWTASGTINPIQSAFLSVFELFGLHGAKIFFLFLLIGVIAGLRDALRLAGWSLVNADPNYITARSYKRQMFSALLLIGMAAVLWVSVMLAGPVMDLTEIGVILESLAVAISIGAATHVGSIVVRIFGRPPWRETASDVIWGLGLVIVAFIVGNEIGTAYSGGVETTVGRYVVMLGQMSMWIGVFFTVDMVVGAFSIHMFNTRQGWFISSFGSDPLVFRQLLRNSGKMFFLAFVLVHNGGLVSTMIDINFGALAYGAYALIISILVARVIELLAVSRTGLLVSGTIVWLGVGLFAAITLVNLPAVIEVLGTIPNLANFADSALPYALSISASSWWLVAGIAIVGFGKTARTFDIVSGRPGVPTLMAAVGFVVVGWAVWAVTDAFTVLGPGFKIAGAVVLGVTFGGAFSLLATFFTEGTPWMVSNPAGWIANSRFRAMNIGGIAAAYLLVVRSVMFDVFVYATLVEWIAIGFISVYITRRIWTFGRELGEPGNSAVPSEDWVSHDQSIDFIDDVVLSKLIREYRNFIERDQRTDLITRLSTVMWESGRSYDDIVKVVSQMFTSRPSQVSWQDRFKRRLSLSQTVDNLSTYQKLREDALQSVRSVLESSSGTLASHSRPSEDMLRELIAEAEKIFVDRSDQSQLVATYCVAIWSKGTDRHSITEILTTLAQYDDPSASWYHVGPLKHRWDAATREIRTRTVKDLRQTVAFGGIS